MRWNKWVAGVAAVGVAVGLGILGCSASGKFGNAVVATEETPINDILDNPGEFAGKTVMIKGQIQQVDDDGKGFMLDNGLGSMIHVKAAGDFKIAAGAKYHYTIAEGKVELDRETGEPLLLATGVEVK
ncbi:MAG: hypothetical protein JSU81_11215 [Candidatus Coatesbacteria bacterium]|nr:MAG: hypothetical protein JSU81_11215 [Candidatus Coatesbacteria bacterium]